MAKRTLHRQGPEQADRRARAAGDHLDPAQAMRVRVIEYEIPDRDGDGELIALITTITDPAAASAVELWRRPTASAGRRKPATISSRRTCAGLARCCGPRTRTWSARRSSGYLAHSAARSSALICRAARRSRHRPPTGSSSCAPSASSARGPLTRPIPPDQARRSLAAVMAEITSPRNLNPAGGTGPIAASLAGPGTTPTGSNGLMTPAPATTARPPSGWSTCPPQHDQVRRSGSESWPGHIAERGHVRTKDPGEGACAGRA